MSLPPLFYSDATSAQILTTLVFPEPSLSQERPTPIQVSDALRGVMISSLMPAGPDAQHMLDPSSMSVVIVIVTAAGLPAGLSSVRVNCWSPDTFSVLALLCCTAFVLVQW